MKAFLLGLSLCSVVATVVILIVPPSPASVATQNSNPAISETELAVYFRQKGATQTSQSHFELADNNTHTVLGTATQTATPTPTPTLPASKSNYSIALLGDSMIDTLGETLPDLLKQLKQRFPNTNFTLLNYGAAATNIEYGLKRLTDNYSYLGKNVSALLSQNPDIIVIESFAYNHWDNTLGDLNRQWLTLGKIVETIKSHNSNTKIVLAATIAPYCPTYTDGSANLPPERKFSECATVKAYLNNLINFATSQKYPLADAFHPSLQGNEGNPLYINAGDHIHPSNEGKQLFAKTVVEAFIKNSLLL